MKNRVIPLWANFQFPWENVVTRCSFMSPSLTRSSAVATQSEDVLSLHNVFFSFRAQNWNHFSFSKHSECVETNFIENIPKLISFCHIQTQIPDFWCPLKLTDVDGSIKTWELPKARYDFLLHNSAGLRFEAEEVRQLINEGLIESPSVTHDESLRIVRVQDKLRKLLGVRFEEDDLNY